MANTSLSSTTSAQFNATIIETSVQKYTMPNLVGDKISDTHYGKYDYGITIKLPSLTRLTANAKTEATDWTPEAPTETAVSLTIDQYYVAGVESEKFEEALANQNLPELYRRSGFDSIAVKMDALQLALATSLTTNTSVGVLGTPLADDDVIKCGQALDDQDAPPDNRFWVISPYQAAEFKKLDRYSRMEYVGNTDVITKNRLGNLYGAAWYQTTQVNGSNAAGHNMLHVHKEALGLATRERPTVMEGDWVLNLSHRIGVYAIWGKAVMRGAFGVLAKGA